MGSSCPRRQVLQTTTIGRGNATARGLLTSAAKLPPIAQPSPGARSSSINFLLPFHIQVSLPVIGELDNPNSWSSQYNTGQQPTCGPECGRRKSSKKWVWLAETKEIIEIGCTTAGPNFHQVWSLGTWPVACPPPDS